MKGNTGGGEGGREGKKVWREKGVKEREICVFEGEMVGMVLFTVTTLVRTKCIVKLEMLFSGGLGL